jgi:hypothetical protein
MMGQILRATKLLLVFIGVQPVIALSHEMLLVGVASFLREFSNSAIFYQFVKQFFASPIHARLMTETLGGIQIEGIAAAGLPGQLFQPLLPSLILGSELTTPGAWFSAVIDKDSTVLSVLATQLLVEVLMLIFGALLVKIGLRGENLGDVLKNASLLNALTTGLGLFVIAQAVWSLFGITLSPVQPGLRDTGVGVGFSILLQLDAQQYDWLMDQSLPIAIPVALSFIALGIAWLLGKAMDRIGFLLPYNRVQPENRSHIAFGANHLALLIALGVLFAVSPVTQRYFGLAMAHLTVPTQEAQIAPQTVGVAAPPTPALATPTDTPTATPTPLKSVAQVTIPTAAPTTSLVATPLPTPSPTPTSPTKVKVRRVGDRFALTVNRQLTTITGMNYNVNYTALPDDVKRKRHRRDFQILRDAGVNAVIGWGVYDEATLEIANEFGIGVIMPFELDAQGTYKNSNYREQVKINYRTFVKRFQRFPGLWGWNPGGDELLHRMETEHRRTPDQLQAASDFLLELSELAYSLDPNHVSIVKEPRDRYVPYIEESTRKARTKSESPDPGVFFIYAVNTYGKPDGITSVFSSVKQHVERRLGIPIVVGEFAPFGLARSERSIYYATIWDTVQEMTPIGGFAYVFGPDQPNPQAPNPYDPLRLLVNEFSLVDIDGRPVDGSLDALAAKWRPLRESLPRPSE